MSIYLASPMRFTLSNAFMLLFSMFFFPLEELSKAFLVRQVQWCQTPSVFVCLGMIFNLFYILTGNIAEYRILGQQYFSFSTLNISSHYLMTCKFPAEKSTDSLMSAPLYVKSRFSLTAFKILSLSLTCGNLIIICLIIIFRLIQFGDLLAL